MYFKIKKLVILCGLFFSGVGFAAAPSQCIIPKVSSERYRMLKQVIRVRLLNIIIKSLEDGNTNIEVKEIIEELRKFKNVPELFSYWAHRRDMVLLYLNRIENLLYVKSMEKTIENMDNKKSLFAENKDQQLLQSAKNNSLMISQFESQLGIIPA
jgi:hypothetical protein